MADIRDTAVMTGCLRAWARGHYGNDCRVDGVQRLSGHSGLLYAFDVVSGSDVDPLVIRVPPPGVRRRNNQDVLRQVPVLQLLQQYDVPAPRARWWGDDTRWFSVPYLIMSRLPGRPPGDVFDPDGGGVPDAARARDMFAQAIGALARMHAIEAADALTGWDKPRSIGDEIDRWLPVLGKSQDPEWRATGQSVREALWRTAPDTPQPGLAHGDFYSNNWLFEDGRLTGIVDWEIVGLGPRPLDLGWVCMMYDPAGWGAMRRAHMHWCPTPDFLLEAYADAAGGVPAHIDWYRAQAGYRLGCLTAYYYELHRTGRRPDAAWDVLAESFPDMMGRALELLE